MKSRPGGYSLRDFIKKAVPRLKDHLRRNNSGNWEFSQETGCGVAPSSSILDFSTNCFPYLSVWSTPTPFEAKLRHHLLQEAFLIPHGKVGGGASSPCTSPSQLCSRRDVASLPLHQHQAGRHWALQLALCPRCKAQGFQS